MYCSNCGCEIPNGLNCCSNCGCAVFRNQNQNAVNQNAYNPMPMTTPVQRNFGATTPSLAAPQKKKGVAKFVIPLVAVLGVLIIAVIVGAIIITNATQSMRDALQKNSADAVYEVYESASGNWLLTNLYDNMICEKIDEVILRLDEYDGTESVEVEGSEYIDDQIGVWYGGLFGYEEHELSDIVHGKAFEKYSELETFMESEFAYYEGVERKVQSDEAEYCDLDEYDDEEYDYKAWGYGEALRFFSQVDSKSSKYDKARKLMRTCSKSYIECVLKTSEMLIAEERYSEAVSELTEASENLAKYNIDAQAILSLLEKII